MSIFFIRVRKSLPAWLIYAVVAILLGKGYKGSAGNFYPFNGGAWRSALGCGVAHWDVT
jgi:hypothetical protein